MRTIIDLELAKRAAKRLGRLPAFWEKSHTERMNLTAVVFGFEHWRSFATNAERGLFDPLDEELGAAELLTRQTIQAARLSAAMPQLRDAFAVITSWQLSAGRLNHHLPSLDEIKPVIRAKEDFFSQGMHRAYILFFREMLDWPITKINLTANVREPLAHTGSSLFDLDIPLLAPAPLAANPTGFEPAELRQLETAYPDGAIALLAEPLVDTTPDDGGGPDPYITRRRRSETRNDSCSAELFGACCRRHRCAVSGASEGARRASADAPGAARFRRG